MCYQNDQNRDENRAVQGGGKKEGHRSDLEKGVDPGNLVPRQKLTVAELHANFQQHSLTFIKYQSHLA